MFSIARKFKPSIIAGAIGAAILQTSAISSVQAQTTDSNDDVEVISVSGIRGSLMSSANIKRESSGVVDAITAEDIGKFPDTNLAESLQRITGVSIDRANNEGNQVSVRGFGPSFNLVTLNNRQMPTSSTLIEDGLNRSFNFREIAAESVSGVEVYKTGKANITSGGIGSTINVKTAKPFDFEGFKAVASAKAVIDTSNQNGDDVTPELSGMISHTFADGKVGLLLSASHAERDSGRERVGAQGWSPNRGTNVDKSGINTSLNPSQTHWAPLTIDVDRHSTQRERQNAQVVLQFAPIDTLTATVDYTLSRFKETNKLDRTSFWFDTDLGGNADSNGTVTNPMRPNDELNFWGFDMLFETENDSVGLNLEWKATDTLSFTLDYHDSTSHAQPNGEESETIINLKNPRVLDTNGDGSPDRGGVDVAYITSPSGRPDVSFNAANLPGGDPFSPNAIQFDLFQTRGLQVENNIKQFQLDGKWENHGDGALDTIHFGIANTEYQMDTNRRRTVSFVPVDISNLNLTFDSIEGFGSDIGGSNNLFPVTANYSATEAMQLVRDQGFFSRNDPTFNGVNEETLALYVSFDFETEFNDLPVNINMGVRWEDTDVNSVSAQPGVVTLNYINTAGRFGEIFTPELTNVELEGGYTQVLPNLDASLEITDDIVGRFSYSKTLARPDLSSLFPSVTFDARPGGPFNASRGNAGLLPLESDNFDISAEWYYDEGSYASVGLFKKYVKNFIGTTVEATTLPDVNGNPLSDPSINPRPGCPDEVVGGNPACFGNADDPAILFDLESPSNLDTAEIDGIELNVQHMFGDTGFGTVVNATFVDGNVEYDVFDIDQTLALTGLSDSANMVAFYEKDQFQVRLAYNWRDDFLLDLSQPQVNGEPEFVEAYGQWDINFRYDINESISVFLEGLNITEETVRRHGRFTDQLITLEQYGARYNLGLSVQF